MIVATEWRSIGWDECPSPLQKAYDNVYEFGEQMRTTGCLGCWTIRYNLITVMKNIPIELRLTPFYFALRGFHDGLAKKRAGAIETIIAAHFAHTDDDSDRIVPKDVGEFLAEKFPGKRA